MKIIIVGVFLSLLKSCLEFRNDNKETDSAQVAIASNISAPVPSGDWLEQQGTSKFGFRFNREDARMLGFEMQIADQAIGPKDILLVDNYVYITDLFHCNVKQVDIRTGKIVRSSPKLFDFATELYVARLKDYIIVMTDGDKFIFLDKELNFVKECTVLNYRWKKEVIGTSKDHFICIRPIEDLQQLETLDMRVRQVKMFEDCRTVIDTIIIKIEDFEDFITNKQHIRGKKYSIIEADDSFLFKTDKTTFRLKEKIPDTFKYLDARNLDFDDNRIAYFELSKDSLFLRIFDF